jgi:hypothetical protein
MNSGSSQLYYLLKFEIELDTVTPLDISEIVIFLVKKEKEEFLNRKDEFNTESH